MNLVIIEGAGKTDTIKKYLGENFEIIATKGHVRDLPVKRFGVNIEKNFEPEYEIMPGKKEIVNILKSKAKTADNIYLATDPDREGEAISWHLLHILGLSENDKVRIEFNEISKNAIHNALNNPRAINKNLVNAQTARRVLDRIVGYTLSPIICKKIKPNLSAGRVQSVALKLVVDRENEIRNFVPKEYWTLNALLYKNSKDDSFKATLSKFNNKKITISTKQEMEEVLKVLKQGNFVVKSVKKTVGKTKPLPPFITSTMQQEAGKKLGFTLKKTTSIAQELYEGVNIKGEGKVALVTYIRTDSVRVSPEAMKSAREFIINNFGEQYVPKTPNVYTSKTLSQDAHEAIRPISLERTPEDVKPYVNPDTYKLYKLIYERFLASQMSESTHNLQVVEIENSNYIFKATGKTPIFDGYLRAYNYTQTKNKKAKKDDEENREDEEGLNDKLPELFENDLLHLIELIDAQKFTKPPLRYTEETLVKEMEDKGIGRPATYAPTITTLATREYTEKDGKYLKPTELGEKVNELLQKHFKDVINVKFTAEMEDKLDLITQKETAWQNIIKEFYKEFEVNLKKADYDHTKVKLSPKQTDEKCEKCGSAMVIRTGRYGEFLACSNFPKCKNIKSLKESKVVSKCPNCGGDVYLRKSKKGTTYYSCSNFPKCNFMSWDMPIDEHCPKCNSYLTQKEFGKTIKIKCSNSKCDYTRQEKFE